MERVVHAAVPSSRCCIEHVVHHVRRLDARHVRLGLGQWEAVRVEENEALDAPASQFPAGSGIDVVAKDDNLKEPRDRRQAPET
jgi:hypothetical protein